MADGGNFELRSVRREMGEDIRRYSREIREALDKLGAGGSYAENLSDIARCAHSVRGVASLVGAWALVFWCEDLEKLARWASLHHERQPERCDMVIAYLRQTREAMENIGARTLDNDLDGALDIYSATRGEMPLEIRDVTSEPARPPADDAAAARARKKVGDPGRKDVKTARFSDALPMQSGQGPAPPVPASRASMPAQARTQPVPSPQKPYLTEANFFLGRIEHILETDVMPAQTPDLWRILARLISSMEYYLLALGSPKLLQTVDRMQQLALKAVEQEDFRTRPTLEALSTMQAQIAGGLADFQPAEAGNAATEGVRDSNQINPNPISPPSPGAIPADSPAARGLAAGNRMSNLRMLTSRFQEDPQPRSRPQLAPAAEETPGPMEKSALREKKTAPVSENRDTPQPAAPSTPAHPASLQPPDNAQARKKTQLAQSERRTRRAPTGHAPRPPATAGGRISRARRHQAVLSSGLGQPLSFKIPAFQEIDPQQNVDSLLFPGRRGVVEVRPPERSSEIAVSPTSPQAHIALEPPSTISVPARRLPEDEDTESNDDQPRARRMITLKPRSPAPQAVSSEPPAAEQPADELPTVPAPQPAPQPAERKIADPAQPGQLPENMPRAASLLGIRPVERRLSLREEPPPAWISSTLSGGRPFRERFAFRAERVRRGLRPTAASPLVLSEFWQQRSTGCALQQPALRLPPFRPHFPVLEPPPAPDSAPPAPDSPWPVVDEAVPTEKDHADTVSRAIQEILHPEPAQKPGSPAEDRAETVSLPEAAPVEPVILQADLELAGIFVDEARELLDSTESRLLAWERESAAPNVHRLEVRRLLHTLKGAAASIGLQPFADDVHVLEDFVVNTAAEDSAPSSVVIGCLLRCIDESRGFLNTLSAKGEAPWGTDWVQVLAKAAVAPPGKPEPPSPGVDPQPRDPAPVPNDEGSAPAPVFRPHFPQIPAPGEPEAPVEPDSSQNPAGQERASLWVDAQRMRNLLNNIGELIIDRNRFGKNIGALDSLREELKQNRARLSDTISQFRREFEYTNLSARRTRQPAVAVAGAGAMAVGPSGVGDDADPALELPGQGPEDLSELEFDRYDEFNVLTRVLEEIVNDIDEIGRSIENVTQRLSDDNAEFSKTSRELQQELAALNMMPARNLFRRLDRVFRSAMEETGKQASVTFDGENTQIDRSMLDQVFTPLMHLVRNAVAHGIEPPEERSARNKPEAGRVSIKAYNLSNQFVLEITDDGRGIDEQAVREKAIARNLLPPETDELPREKVLDLLFSPGFTTSESVSSLAGRGIGLDVVKREVESLNGALRLSYEPEKFCRWTVQLPLTLSAAEAAIVEVGRQKFALPLGFVEGGILLDPEMMTTENNQLFLQLEEPDDEGERLAIRNLGDLLGIVPENPDTQQALQLNTGGFRVALRIDRLHGREEIVVRSLGHYLGHHPFYSGATIDADGMPVLILNAPNLATMIRSGESLSQLAIADRDARRRQGMTLTDEERVVQPLSVLVVDDSLSVRKSLERALMQQGCEVSLAMDGVDALELMRARLFDIIFTDLEMPNMDGFQLITETRGLDLWASVPIYIITSRVTEKYRERALARGATGFLPKPVTADDLSRILDTIDPDR